MNLIIKQAGNGYTVACKFYKDGIEMGFFNKFSDSARLDGIVSRMSADKKWMLENVDPVDFEKKYVTKGEDL